jgi:hypothetical protein
VVDNSLMQIFTDKIKGKQLPPMTHDGAIGHWLEAQFGVSANNDDAADWFGYELKTGKSKTTFGDWSADWYLWKVPNSGISSRDTFLQTFGTQSRPDRPGRYSWSGRVFPKVNVYNKYGQIMQVEANSDITIYYSYSMDGRFDKQNIVPTILQRDNVELAKWYRSTLEPRVNRKFGQNGWVKFVQNGGIINGMIIGGPMYFNQWIGYVRTGEIFLDSGMYYDPNKPNIRPYSNWRAANNFWERLAIEHV